MIPFLVSIILPIVVYLFIQFILLIIVNKSILKNKLKFQEIINIAIISGLLVTLVWIITLFVSVYFLNFLGMFIGTSGYLILSLIVASLFTFITFLKSIYPFVKNISIKAIRNLCIFMMLFNALLILSFSGYIQQKYQTENQENYIQQSNKIDNQEKDLKELEEKYVIPINTGVKLIPDPNTDPETMLHAGPNPQRMQLGGMEITAGQKWNKNTKLKYCVRYKTNVNSSKYRSTILHANSSLESKYIFQVDIYEYKTDYHCDSWVNIRGGGTYRIIIPFGASSSSDKDTFHEICIDDINSQLDYCATKWGINKDDAYLTNIHQASILSPSGSLNNYAIFDYIKIFIDENQVSEALFPNQNFDKFLGSANDNKSNDFNGWMEYKNVYAVDIDE
ncbi:MAG: hypothetical protein KAI71_00960 [Candidatus Pacebacteria bacterium]|nr:hypothetical protein [Candidatus Paceibacterota bacterium]